MKRVLSGIQPTADSFHLGNYLGAIRQWVALQDSHDAFYCVVDLHALTVDVDPKVLTERTLASVAQLIALGVDPNRCTIFVQSQVSAHNQLGWVMECLAGFGEASRMTQFKDKSQKAGADRTTVGLFTYPLLQAADIMLYGANLVPVGEDQRQHIELTRDLGQRFNTRYGETLVIPEAQIMKAGAKINDLQDPSAKMSKSAASQAGVIDILDEANVNIKKIKSAVTDMGKEIRFDEKEKPGISNLLTILSHLGGKSIPALEAEFAGSGYGDFKMAVANTVADYFAPVRTRTQQLLTERSELLAIIEAGAKKAEVVASDTLARVYANMGLLPRHR
ncbi:MAG: tryptophan--tRNA ligase [Actinobacteria bacterium]|uniref:tryptophan--tRNA ligase n=1 Tax=freshwater metagenome TaxID=449393 RepID=A0A6J6DRR7_9ZZZZ|nr:tryptophan--tRNA ligase [Actinomycetota bacterium]